MTRRAIALAALSFAAGAACVALSSPGDRREAPDAWRLVILWDDGESDIADSGMTWADCHGRIADYSPDVRALEVFCEPDDVELSK